MTSSSTYVPATVVPAASKRDKWIVVAVFTVAALLLWAVTDFTLHTSLTATYRKEASAVMTKFDGVVVTMRESDDTFGEAAKQLPVAESALSELTALTPPRNAREFHALLVDTYIAYTDAIRMIASVDDNPLLAMALAASIRDKLNTYHNNLDRLDFANLRVKY